MPPSYPETAEERDLWILSHRPRRNDLDPFQPYAFLVEDERAASGEIVQVATVFLTNRECPWRCLMCDLWRNTLAASVPVGAIPTQIDYALQRLAPARQIKLYNNGSFFDPRAIPLQDHPAIASRVAAFQRVIVECHPALVGNACIQFKDLLAGKLEVAMGLETVHPDLLDHLNKRMTIREFEDAAHLLRKNDIDLRVFILVKPPFMREEEALEWAVRSLEFAFKCGATAATLIPTRGGNGAMEALAASGQFSPPKLATLEAVTEHGIAMKKGRVFADLWDVRAISRCAGCDNPRIARLHAMNLQQSIFAVYCVRTLRREKLSDTYDIAVVGSGFGGSLLATIARKLGHSVVLIEKGTHPRVVIGESSTPLSNLLLEEIATRYGLSSLRPLAKWGSWQRSYPQVACGLKRGFTFHHHVPGAPVSPDPEHRDQLLVAASPRDEIADTHWYRADFDHLLVQEAEKIGVEYVDQVRLNRISDGGNEMRLEGQRNGHDVKFRARFVVDGTGPRGFLHRAHELNEIEFPGYPRTQSLYSHFSGVRRLEETPGSRIDEPPPYPIDDAAVHHVFDGGWIWVLQFNNGVTSAGVAATDEFASRMRFKDGAKAWGCILDLIPALKEQFAAAKVERPFVHLPIMAFRSSAITGSNWALLPSAAGFVDPLLSTGIPLTLLGVTRLAEIIEQDWGTQRFDARLRVYSEQTDGELVATARLVACLYANMNNFPLFVALTLLYFAAASFSEAARRLDRPHLASSFLLCDDPVFGPESVRLLERAQRPLTKRQSNELTQDILKAIEPINVAGLGREERRNWYPVVADDLLNAAGKLGASRGEVSELLRRCGFYSDPDSAGISTMML